jgi:hypothetical protein
MTLSSVVTEPFCKPGVRQVLDRDRCGSTEWGETRCQEIDMSLFRSAQLPVEIPCDLPNYSTAKYEIAKTGCGGT